MMDTSSAPPQSTVVLLIRHGATPTTGQVLPGRAPGLHLSDKGKVQAAEVAKRLDGLPITALYSSPMERAQETAAPTAHGFDLEIMLDEGLVECEFGEWTGRALSELSVLPEWKTVQNKPSEFRFPAGESFMEMQERCVNAISVIAEKHPGEVLALFSHADPLKAVIAHFVGTPLDSFQRIHIDTASVSAVEFSNAGTRMLVTNSRTGSLGYLREKA